MKVLFCLVALSSIFSASASENHFSRAYTSYRSYMNTFFEEKTDYRYRCSSTNVTVYNVGKDDEYVSESTSLRQGRKITRYLDGGKTVFSERIVERDNEIYKRIYSKTSKEWIDENTVKTIGDITSISFTDSNESKTGTFESVDKLVNGKFVNESYLRNGKQEDMIQVESERI